MFDLQIQWFALSREDVLTSLLWRWITSHIVHFNIEHLAVNLAGLFFLLLLNMKFIISRNGLISFILLSGWISSCLWLFSTGIEVYAGLSGILYGFFILATFTSTVYSFNIKCLLSMLCFFKVFLDWSQIFNYRSTEIFLNISIATDAHFFGVIGGLGILFLFSIKKKELLIKIIKK